MIRRASQQRSYVSALALALGHLACADDPSPAPVESSATPAAAPLFAEVAAEAGLRFRHDNDAKGEFRLIENMGSGCAFVDIDDDGFLDIYLIQSGPYPPRPDGEANRNQLYRNRGDGTFEDISRRAGIDDAGFGFGVAAGDYDRDGDVDIYVSNFGRNCLYQNQSDGTFVDVTDQAGVGDEGCSTSATFVDYDHDGDLDLYVCNYIGWSHQIERACHTPNGSRDYCSPLVYQRPQADRLYRNDGNVRFTDISESAGIRAAPATSLGVVCADFDGDRRTDIYVANDLMANHLWLNQGNGTFIDDALNRGCAMNESGHVEAGMGVAAEDIDDNGFWDLFMVHLDSETNTLYRNVSGYFDDDTDRSRLGVASRPFTGFGTGFFDYDCDGYADIFIANGRVRIQTASGAPPYAERNQLFRGRADGRFDDVSSTAGPALDLVEVSRGAAFGDYDNDGDVDILLTNNGGPVRLLRNEARGRNHWLMVQLIGESLDRDGIGARIELHAGGRARQRLVQAGYGYCSSHDARVHFGLGATTRIDRLIVHWPNRKVTRLDDVEVDQILRIAQATGVGSAPQGRRGVP